MRREIAPSPFGSASACGAGATGPSAFRRAGIAHCSATMTRASGSGSSMTSPTCRPDRSMPSTWSASFRTIRTRMGRTLSKIRVAWIGGADTKQVNKDGTKIGLLGNRSFNKPTHAHTDYTASVPEHRPDTAEPLSEVAYRPWPRFRRTRAATILNPVPNNSSEAGSGTGAGSPTEASVPSEPINALCTLSRLRTCAPNT